LFQIKQLVKHFDKLPKERATPRVRKNCFGKLPVALGTGRCARTGSASQAGGLRARRDIRQTLRTLPQLSDAIAANYFAHSRFRARVAGRFNELSHHPSHALRIRRPVSVSHHVARLEPRATAAQSLESFSLQIFPEPALRKARTDYFGNQLCFFAIQEIHSSWRSSPAAV